MDIPKEPLNSIQRIAYESRKVEIEVVNQQTVVREAAGQIASSRSS
jgi:hypothetical protein